MKYLMCLIPLMLAGCGSASSTSTPVAGVVTIVSGVNISYQLIATIDSNNSPSVGTQVVADAVTVGFPLSIVTLSDANWNGRATLTMGTLFCDYQSNQQGTYIRQDGSCDTLTPNSSFVLPSGSTITLALQGQPNQQTAVEAIIDGVTQ